MSNVLLIEPDAILAETYAAALRDAGHVVAHVRSAQAAIHAADEETPDIVFLELRLAGHDGVEFMHEFRSYTEWQHIPIVVTTYMDAQALRPLLPALRELGVEQCLYKPTSGLATLVSTARELCRGR